MKLINAEALFTVAGGNVGPENRETYYANIGYVVGVPFGMAVGISARHSFMECLLLGAIAGYIGLKIGPAVANAVDEYAGAQLERLKYEANNQAVNS